MIMNKANGRRKMQIFEFIMLACFGLSWPISVYKSIKSKSTKGKSLVFMLAIIIGYISGIIGKVVNGQINYVLAVYCFNLFVVTVDLILYFVYNRRNKTNYARKVNNNSNYSIKAETAILHN